MRLLSACINMLLALPAIGANPWADLAGGLTSKIHAVVDTNGLTVRLGLTTGEASDNRIANTLLSRLESGSMLLADRGHDDGWVGALVARNAALAKIQHRCNRNEPIRFSPHLYRAHNLVERFYSKIK